MSHGIVSLCVSYKHTYESEQKVAEVEGMLEEVLQCLLRRILSRCHFIMLLYQV